MAAPALEAIGGPAEAIGAAGTITTLAAIDLGRYDRDLIHRHRPVAGPHRGDRRSAWAR